MKELLIAAASDSRNPPPTLRPLPLWKKESSVRAPGQRALCDGPLCVGGPARVPPAPFYSSGHLLHREQPSISRRKRPQLKEQVTQKEQKYTQEWWRFTGKHEKNRGKRCLASAPPHSEDLGL